MSCERRTQALDARVTVAKRIVFARWVATALVGIAGCASGAERSAVPPRHDDLSIPSIPTTTTRAADAADLPPSVDIANNENACPSEEGKDQDASKRACPPAIVSVWRVLVPHGKIGFAPHGTQPSPVSATLLDEATNLMKQNKEWNLAIEGHTDTLEPSPLGQLRADAVRDELVKRGVGASRITTRNAGSSKPMSTNVTVVGRAQNRRVEILVR